MSRRETFRGRRCRGGSPARIVCDSLQETGQALFAQDIRIVRSGVLDLEEVLSHLMRQKQEREQSVSGRRSRA